MTGTQTPPHPPPSLPVSTRQHFLQFSRQTDIGGTNKRTSVGVDGKPGTRDTSCYAKTFTVLRAADSLAISVVMVMTLSGTFLVVEEDVRIQESM
ncbi:hypothetical protein E2C01_010104 [Portunus trituberculatus]|uniref:Uncharacterized protein n=1 Tax=Portunus trituberculatus TaxID=210409 RepID=A0A5B7D7L6_PORTR|nr:hypothetical protein [Portunus trituberculatus]